MGAQWRVDECPMEVDRCLTEGAWMPDREQEWPNRGRDGCPTEGGVSGGGPTEEYIHSDGPQFWPLSSSAQFHLLKMRVRRMLLRESGVL
jgi:hypothetical protein